MPRSSWSPAILVAILTGVLLGGTVAQAQVVSIDFTAVVTEATEGLIFRTPIRDLKVGDTIAGRYFFDSSTPNTGSVPEVGLYRQTAVPFGIAIFFSQRTLGVDPTVPHVGNMSFTTRVLNFPAQNGGDSHFVEGRHMTSDRSGFIISWQLSDASGQAITSTALPTAPPAIFRFPDRNELFAGVVGEFSTLQIRARVISARLTPTVVRNPQCDSLDATLRGGDGNDTLVGTDGDDVIVGFGGNDVIDGRGGHDVICGGDGDDVLIGGAGHDRLFGGVGNDLLDGGLGDDRLFGSTGQDWLLGGPGADFVLGEGGSDGLEGGADGDLLNGGADDDVITGDDGADRLLGEAGNDWLLGGADADLLSGGDGDDGLEGNLGADNCDGGAHLVSDFADASCETIAAVP